MSIDDELLAKASKLTVPVQRTTISSAGAEGAHRTRERKAARQAGAVTAFDQGRAASRWVQHRRYSRVPDPLGERRAAGPHMSIQRRRLALVILCSTFGLPRPGGAAEAFPSRPIRLVVGYAAGGAADAAARHLARIVSATLGQNVVVENRPGASGSIAAATVAGSPADGHTLLYATTDLILHPLLTGAASYDPLRDFVPVVGVSRRPLVLVVPSASGFRSVSELAAAARARPDAVAYESSGVGSVEHLIATLFGRLIGAQLVHVPYKGSAPGILALLGNQVQFGFEVPLGIAEHVRSGRLVTLLTTAPERLASLPAVPTAREAGLAGLDVRGHWGGIFARAGTPQDRVAKLNAAFAAARNAPETVAHAVFQESISLAGPADAFAALLRGEHERWSTLVREAGLRLNP